MGPADADLQEVVVGHDSVHRGGGRQGGHIVRRPESVRLSHLDFGFQDRQTDSYLEDK